jgi:hypothetical protein
MYELVFETFKSKFTNLLYILNSAIYAVIIFIFDIVLWGIMLLSKEEKLKNKIALKLKNLRKLKGFSSYEDFAIEKDLDRKQYWRIENGSNITLKTLLKLLEIHKISLKDFFNEFE